MSRWLEISLTLDGELAEAVADVLARYAYQGVSTESTAVEADPEDEGRAVGPWRVRAYLPADDAEILESTRQKIERDLFYLGMICPLPQPVYTRVADAGWAELWKANYHPMRVGSRLVVVPAWLYDSFRADPARRSSGVPDEAALSFVNFILAQQPGREPAAMQALLPSQSFEDWCARAGLGDAQALDSAWRATLP